MEQENMELFTVQQFALQVGKTSQAIYQQAKGRLKQYVKKGEGGQVLIQAEALKLYKDKQTSQPATVDKDIQALQSENERLRAEIEAKDQEIEEQAQEIRAKDQEITRLTMERDNLREQLAREQELSRERLTRLEAADRRIDSLLEKIPPMLPAGNAGGGLFGWFKRKKGDTTT